MQAVSALATPLELRFEGVTQINEEELYAGVIETQLGHIDSNLASTFRMHYEENLQKLKRADGYVSQEAAANRALQEMTDSNGVDLAEVRAKAFRAAQLDDNLTALYDSRGSGEDPTIAVRATKEAVSRAIETLQGIEDGSIPFVETTMTTSGMPQEKPLDGSGGFLWKPVSESDGRLVVLLPRELNGSIMSVEIHQNVPPDESTLIERGRYSGNQHNGNRSHFRFSRPGSGYGADVYLVARLENGETSFWNIPSGGRRYD